jgi:hypothetical protein
MVRRFLLSGAVLLFLLLTVPACSNSTSPGSGKSTLPPDQAPPNPRPAGRPG